MITKINVQHDYISVRITAEKKVTANLTFKRYGALKFTCTPNDRHFPDDVVKNFFNAVAKLYDPRQKTHGENPGDLAKKIAAAIDKSATLVEAISHIEKTEWKPWTMPEVTS